MVARDLRERVAVALTAATSGQSSGQGASAGTSSGGGTSTAYGTGGISGGKIVIGGFFDISGPVDSSVERDTMRAYMQNVNAAGGINGRQVQYVWCDSKYDASSAHACAHCLASIREAGRMGAPGAAGAFGGARRARTRRRSRSGHQPARTATRAPWRRTGVGSAHRIALALTRAR